MPILNLPQAGTEASSEEEVQISEPFDSVWDAIEDDPAERERLKLLSWLMSAVSEHIKTQGWTQKQAARILGVTQPRISDLMRGKISLFSVDALVGMLGAAGLHLEAVIVPAKPVPLDQDAA